MCKVVTRWYKIQSTGNVLSEDFEDFLPYSSVGVLVMRLGKKITYCKDYRAYRNRNEGSVETPGTHFWTMAATVWETLMTTESFIQ